MKKAVPSGAAFFIKGSGCTSKSDLHKKAEPNYQNNGNYNGILKKTYGALQLVALELLLYSLDFLEETKNVQDRFPRFFMPVSFQNGQDRYAESIAKVDQHHCKDCLASHNQPKSSIHSFLPTSPSSNLRRQQHFSKTEHCDGSPIRALLRLLPV
ncbi:MAG: hypothetical protein K6E31_01095 [bacterium]|nr:hypothetical protein [bacterium]